MPKLTITFMVQLPHNEVTMLRPGLSSIGYGSIT